MLKKMLLGGAALMFVAGGGLTISASSAFANKVDCAKVMSEASAGKKTSEIAKELSISTSSVYRCKKKEGATKSSKTTSSTSTAGAKSSSSKSMAKSAAGPAASPAAH